MSTDLLTALVVPPTAAVIVALFVVLWKARTSRDGSRTAIVTGIALAAWAVAVMVLGARGAFIQPDGGSIPPLGIALLVAVVVMGAALRASPSLRRLLVNQRHLIQLNVWRLEGIVFLLLMLGHQMPALWALPAGIGDIAIGVTAFPVARRLAAPPGRLPILFNLFGLADLVVAIALGMTTNPGPLQLFHTDPTSELVTRFPLVLVPAFLVPLALVLHVVSLAQLRRGAWSRPTPAR